MNKVKFIALVSFVVLIASQKSFAAMPVIDAAVAGVINTQTTANTAAFSKQLAESVKQTKEMIKTAKNAESQLESITGNLTLNQFLEGFLGSILADYESLKNPINNSNNRIEGKIMDLTKTADIGKILHKNIYSTRNDPRQDVYAPLMEKFHGDSAQAAIELSQAVIAKAPEKIEMIQNTARQADSNQTLKEAVDVNNHLLVQMLVAQNETNQLLAQLTRSMASKNYRGTYDTAQKRKKSHLERITGSTKSEKNLFKPKQGMPRRGRSVADEVFGNIN